MNAWIRASLFAVLVATGLTVFAQTSSTKKTASTAPPLTFGAWVIVEAVDKMDDQRRCYLRYRKADHVFSSSSGNVVNISYSGRGGVSSYQYRLGKQPATELKVANEIEIGSGVIGIPVFDDVLSDADRILVSGLTVLKAPINEDIDLAGFKQARAAMREKCL